VVFPRAELKVFLTASVEVRALRRYKELVAKGQTVDLEQLKKDIAFRDKQDSERAIAPLRQAEDAVYLDTSAMNMQQVVDAILKLVRERS
jgi:cytidylate kinase